MIELTPAQARRCEGWFCGIADTALLSALQGYMGAVRADSAEKMHWLTARCGDYHYFGGDPMAPETEEVLRSLPVGSYLLSYEPRWQQRFRQVLGGRLEWQTRSILKRDMSGLNAERLQKLCAVIPEGFVLTGITAEMAEELRASEWSHEYLNQFESAQDFAQRGYGYALVHGREIACIGCTFSIYDDGAEMGIATNPAFRRQGLATIAAARMVLEVLRRGQVLNWDAANLVSLHLAEKMGFQKAGEYEIAILGA